MPYLTPQDIPESDDCRSLSIPASSEWLALFGGALTTFLYAYNWEQTTGIGVDETIAKMREIIDGFYEGCVTCDLPGGYANIRIRSDGKLEQLVNGEYVEPTGDYVIPPPEAREGGSEADQMCLAAKNAVNVLEMVYESLSESWASELSEDQAIIALIAALVAAVGFAFAPIVWALVTPLLFFFGLVYKALDYITADLWDEDFTQKLECLFLNCAQNDAGVVTFDWSCIEDGLQGLATEGGFNELQTRLNLQIGYILMFIGGVDALNLAARTTDITNDDCSDCDRVWGRRMDFTLDDWGFAAVVDPVNGGTVGSYSAGVGFVTRYYPAGGADISLQTARTWSPASPVQCIRLTVSIDEYYGSPAGIYVRTAEYEGTVFYSEGFINEAGENVYLIDASDSNGGYNFQLYNLGNLSCTLIMAEMWGTGDPPDVGVAIFDPPPC